MEISSDIITLSGSNPGPTVAVFAGVHGNEKIGILAVQKVLLELTLTRGTLHIAFANPPAIEKGVRFVGKNLNRCFTPENTGTTQEDKRARQLMQVLDGCDALLDLHAFNDNEGEPFVICEDNALDVARIFDVPLISTGWFEAEPGGTDSYMHQAGKVGVCLECGPLSKPEQYVDFTVASICQFLKYYDMIDSAVPFSTTPKRVVAVNYAVTRTSEDFTLDPTLRSFQPLIDGQELGSQNGEKLVAKAGEYIIFPRPNASIGGEAYLIGRVE